MVHAVVKSSKKSRNSSPEKVFELLATIQEEWQRIPEKHKYTMYN